MKPRIPDGVALLTGATGGLGRAISQRLSADGWRLALTYRSSREEAERVADELSGAAQVFEFDATDRKRPKALVREVEDLMGPVRGLVNNLGAQQTRLLAMTSDDLWDQMLDVNLSSAFRMSRAVLPGMVRQRGGSVVNVSSLGALRGVAGEGAYSAAKSGMIAMTRTIARELGKRSIRANSVVPGFVETEMTAGLTEEQIAGLRSAECLAQPTRAADVAAAVSFLLSNDSLAITGQALVVDSGASC